MISKYIKEIFFLVLLISSTSEILVGQFIEQRWTMEDGLPSNNIHDIAQTPDGFIWIGTDNGLARFDGLTFETFNRGNTPQILNNEIKRLFVQKDGSLLIGTSGGGVAKFRNNFFSRPYDHLSDSSMYVLSFAEINDQIWVGSDGTGLYNFYGDTVRVYKEPELPRNHIFSLSNFKNDSLVAGVLSSGTWFIKSGNIFHRHPPTELDNGVINDFYFGNDSLWIASSNSIYMYANEEYHHYSLRDLNDVANFAISITKDSKDRMWVGTLEGVYYSDDYFESIKVLPGFEVSTVPKVMEDREKNIWIGDWGNGLVRLKRSTFKNILFKGADSENLSTTSISTNSKNELWVATSSGLRKISVDNEVEQIGADKLSSPSPQLVLADSQDRILISHLNFGTTIDVYENGKFHQHKAGKIDGKVNVIYEDPTERLWIGTEKGLEIWDEKPHRLINTNFGMVNNVVRSLVKQVDTLWIGTNGGLHKLVDGDKNAIHVSSEEDKLGSIITALYVDHQNWLWIGTYNHGLSLYRNGEFTQFTSQQGLPSDVIWQIVEDDFGYFWMGSNTGITRVHRNSLLHVTTGDATSIKADFFTKRDGLPDNGIAGNYQPTAIKANDGNIYFPTNKGVTSVDPSGIITNTISPKPIILEAIVDLNPVNITKGVTLSHEARTLEVRYTAPSFTSPEEIQFEYRLYPYEKVWQPVKTRRTAYYTNIPPGNYTFQVKAINEYGVESLQPAVLSISALPAFWETIWFYIFLVLVVLAMCYAGYSYQLYNFKKLNNLRLKISKDLHDEIGSNLASIAIRSEVIKKREVLSEQGSKDLNEIGSLSRLTSEAMRDIVWLINPENDRIENVIVKLKEVTANLLPGTDWNFNTNIKSTEGILELRKRRTIILITKEVIHNIVKHAQASQVDISLSVENQSLILIIQDDGIGFDDSKETRTGMGLSNLKRRADEIGGHIFIESEKGTGTRVKLIINKYANT